MLRTFAHRIFITSIMTLSILGYVSQAHADPVLKITHADGKPLNFGDTVSFTFPYIGEQTYGAEKIILQNIGTQDLVIQNLALFDDPNNAAFSLEQAPVLPLTISAGQSSVLMIHFAPKVAGTFQGKLVVTSNDFSPAGAPSEINFSGTRDIVQFSGGGFDVGGGCVANIVAGQPSHGAGSFYLLALLAITLVSTRMIRSHRKTIR